MRQPAHSIAWPRNARRCTVTKVAHKVVTTDAEIDAALAEAELNPPHRAMTRLVTKSPFGSWTGCNSASPDGWCRGSSMRRRSNSDGSKSRGPAPDSSGRRSESLTMFPGW